MKKTFVPTWEDLADPKEKSAIIYLSKRVTAISNKVLSLMKRYDKIDICLGYRGHVNWVEYDYRSKTIGRITLTPFSCRNASDIWFTFQIKELIKIESHLYSYAHSLRTRKIEEEGL
jgi:hypothetical protein